MPRRMKRRAFLRNLACGGAGLAILAHGSSARTYRANEKVDVALIGVGGRGRWFVDNIPRMENVVAICDIDDRKLGETFKRWGDLGRRFAASEHSWEKRAAPALQRLAEAKMKTYRDFRKMLDGAGKGIDAVVVATPDHTHAVASAAAIRAGKAVFCEKPLTRTIRESRALRELARKHKVATSMGNQGTYSGAFRRALELIRNGMIGEVKEVHVWNSGGGADRKQPPKGTSPVPEYLKWDLWLGPASDRPYHNEWMKRNLWRDFGTCQLGNWASHTANLGFMALKVHELWLGDWTGKPHPRVRVEARSSGINRLSFPKWEHITWQIPARAKLGPITINWYNGAAPGVLDVIARAMQGRGEQDRQRARFAGTHIVGTKGSIYTTGHNMSFRLLPEDQFKGVQCTRPETVESSRGPEQDWFAACRGGKPAWANFDYASSLNEFLMLGNVATQFDGPVDYDPRAASIVNNDKADQALSSPYRKGWSL
jgi:hypothetical protein